MKEVVQLDDADVVDGAGEAVEVLMDHVAADQRALEEVCVYPHLASEHNANAVNAL